MLPESTTLKFCFKNNLKRVIVYYIFIFRHKQNPFMSAIKYVVKLLVWQPGIFKKPVKPHTCVQNCSTFTYFIYI